jgi:hypothetical protein
MMDSRTVKANINSVAKASARSEISAGRDRGSLSLAAMRAAPSGGKQIQHRRQGIA